MESMGIRDMNNLAFFKGKKVFLTGHTGFKGSWLSRILILAGAEVTGYALEAPKEAKLFDTLQLENNMHSVIGYPRPGKTYKYHAGGTAGDRSSSGGTANRAGIV